jgi:hypothetical protein
MSIRRQLTLFVNPADAKVIEAVRQKYNPMQFGLIRSHVTLCREEEIQDIATIVHALRALCYPTIRLSFGPVATFSEGKGAWLPSSGENLTFHNLRTKILGTTALDNRNIHPHLTLMHPRNSACSPTIFQEISRYSLPTELNFDTVCLIEQNDGQAWQILQSFPLIA